MTENPVNGWLVRLAQVSKFSGCLQCFLFIAEMLQKVKIIVTISSHVSFTVKSHFLFRYDTQTHDVFWQNRVDFPLYIRYFPLYIPIPVSSWNAKNDYGSGMAVW